MDDARARTAARPRLPTPVLAVGLCLVWSTAFVFVELALRHATASQFAALRSVAAVPALAVGLLVRDATGLRGALRSSRTHLLGLLLGAVSVAGVVSSWIFAVPVLAAVYGVVLLDEPVSAGLGAGVAAVAVGILLVTVPPRALPPPA